jgi:hypothetical protein
MLHRLFGMLVSGLMIFFPVVHGRSAVGMCGEFVELGSSLVRVTWHYFISSVAASVYDHSPSKTDKLLTLAPRRAFPTETNWHFHEEVEIGPTSCGIERL